MVGELTRVQQGISPQARSTWWTLERRLVIGSSIWETPLGSTFLVLYGNSSWVHSLGEMTVKLPLPSGGTLTLNDVLYAPNMRCNLISLSKVDKNEVEVNVKRGNMTFLKDGVEVA
ncbi:hypothetical protein AMTR_s00097p00115440 [Amborella trichopoda]|uniref:Retrovirus-related Pol polyprotein from transposon TNT 1-94-like beta-barrel domain-containing protein n=1 Tax=Amborella trichopoda TaxID=13333 RepID=W1NVT6_AMBTC|nr:hypothetical protein AMTR_s00097p00115440 [Amborella trichopoda]